MSALLKARKGISKTTFMLVPANKKVSSKNQILPILSWIENSVITVPYVFRAELSIFCVPIPVGQIERPNLAAITGVIALTLLPELIKALTSPA